MATNPDNNTSNLPQLSTVTDSARFPVYSSGTKSVNADRLAAYTASKIFDQNGLLSESHIIRHNRVEIPIIILSQTPPITEFDLNLHEGLGSWISDTRLVYVIPLHRLLLRSGISEFTYFTTWGDAALYGTQTEDGIIPFSHRIYTWKEFVDDNIIIHFCRWNGHDLEELLPDFPDTKVFDDLFNALCHPYGLYETDDDYIGKILYVDGQKIYRLNGLDLTYEEAVIVVADAIQRGNRFSAYSYVVEYMGRTNIPPSIIDSWYSLHSNSMGDFVITGKLLEVLYLNTPDKYVSVQGEFLINSPQLHTVIGKIRVENENFDMFYDLPMLQNINIIIAQNVSALYLNEMPAISISSLLFMVENSPYRSNICVVYIQSDAYVRIFDTPSEELDELLNKAAANKFSFVEY